MLKLGIITTIADAEDYIDAFIYYHQQIGFEHFYIFIDDNDTQTFDRLKSYPQVTVFLKDESLLQKWNQYLPKLSTEKIVLIDQEVMVRQELNFYIGFDLAKEAGIDWVIHMDLDELFYPNGHNLSTYFAKLQLDDIRAVTHLNYESISTELHSQNIYLSSSYFKINFLKYKSWMYNKEQKEFLEGCGWLSDKYFLYYQNGKSSVSTYGKSIQFFDVHSIAGDGVRKMGRHSDPIVLHYPCARLIDFVKKYRRLGDFSDSWMGFPRVGDFIDTIHLRARDFVNQQQAPDFESFYRAHFLIEPQRIENLCALNLAKYIDLPHKILKSFANELSEIF